MTDEKIREKLKELLVDEQEISATLIDRVKRFVRLTKDGKVIFMTAKDKLPLRSQIMLYLAGKRFAKELGLIETDVSSIEEISASLSADYFVVAARLKELKDQQMVLAVERGGYTVQLAKLNEILDAVEKSFVNKS
ncbi:MAG: hypothetical protein RMI49_03580 [Candidatus Caldarchaeum sp.]|nr:hypothetical protein [Candidatus Caldarchaeum sp.]